MFTSPTTVVRASLSSLRPDIYFLVVTNAIPNGRGRIDVSPFQADPTFGLLSFSQCFSLSIRHQLHTIRVVLWDCALERPIDWYSFLKPFPAITTLVVQIDQGTTVEDLLDSFVVANGVRPSLFPPSMTAIVVEFGMPTYETMTIQFQRSESLSSLVDRVRQSVAHPL